MDSLFETVSPKVVFGVCFAVMCILEIAIGFLKLFKGYLKTLSLKPFLLMKLIAVNAALFTLPFDVWILQKVQSLQNPVLDKLILLGAFFGRNQGTWGPLAVLYLISLCFRLRKFQELCFGAVLSSALTGLSAHILKFIMMRARPYNDLGPYHFFDVHGWTQNVRAFQSFPSGDVAIASGAAAFLFLSLRRFYFSWIFLLVPVFTALSRVDLNKHWPSDTVFSIFISFAVARFVLDYFQYRNQNH